MGNVEWVKLATDFIADSKIRHIRAQKGGDSMALMWTMLLCRAGAVNDRGRVYVAPGVPYTTVGLAAEFGMQRKLVADALRLFEQLGMVRMEPDGLVIVNWAQHQNVDGMERLRGADDAKSRAREASRRYRERQKEASRANDAAMTASSENHDGVITASSANDGAGHDAAMTHKDKDKDKDPEEDYQKKLGVDDEYRRGSRARARSAGIAAQAIEDAGWLPQGLPNLFDVIEEAMRLGYTFNVIMHTARNCAGDWARFASSLMAGTPH